LHAYTDEWLDIIYHSLFKHRAQCTWINLFLFSHWHGFIQFICEISPRCTWAIVRY